MDAAFRLSLRRHLSLRESKESLRERDSKTDLVSDPSDPFGGRKLYNRELSDGSRRKSAAREERSLLSGIALPAELQDGVAELAYVGSVIKFDSTGFPQNRTVALLRDQLYILTPRTNMCRARIPLRFLSRASLSPYWDRVVCLHFSEGLPDIVLVVDTMTLMLEQLRAATPDRPLAIVVQDTIIFRNTDGYYRLLKFECHDKPDRPPAKVFIDLRDLDPAPADSPPPDAPIPEGCLFVPDDDDVDAAATAASNAAAVAKVARRTLMLKHSPVLSRMMNIIPLKPGKNAEPLSPSDRLLADETSYVFYRWLSDDSFLRLRPDITARYWQVQGMRDYMEDMVAVERTLRSGVADVMVALFDGHGGREVAEYVSTELIGYIEDRFMSRKSGGDTRRALLEGFAECNKYLQSQSWAQTTGSTALVVLIKGDTLYIANAGDCRALLITDTTHARLTRDHKVSDDQEAARIRALNGVIKKDRLIGPSGDINVARAFGDRRYHPWVTATPDIVERRIHPDDKYLVLACDGVWDVVSEEAAAQSVRKHQDPKRLCSMAYALGSHDNLSAIVLCLNEELRSRTPRTPRSRSPVDSRSMGADSPLDERAWRYGAIG